MDFFTGSIAGGLTYLLGKAAQKGGGKLLDKGLDRAVEKSGSFLAGLYRRIFAGEDFSDLLATPERRELAGRHLAALSKLLSELIGELDVLYGSAAHGSSHLAGKVTMQNYDLAAGIIERLERKQGHLLKLLGDADKDFPSLLPLIGYFVVVQQSQAEIEQMLEPAERPLDTAFAFMTFVTRTANSRAGLIVRCKETLEKEIAVAHAEASKGTITLQLVLRLRSFERLTHVLAYAVAYVEQLLRGKPAPKDIPRAVQVVGSFARAERAIEVAVRAHGSAGHEPLPVVVDEARQLGNECWRILGSDRGGMVEKLSLLERNAKRIQKKLKGIAET